MKSWTMLKIHGVTIFCCLCLAIAGGRYILQEEFQNLLE
jgi:hypothetical protein